MYEESNYKANKRVMDFVSPSVVSVIGLLIQNTGSAIWNYICRVC